MPNLCITCVSHVNGSKCKHKECNNEWPPYLVDGKSLINCVDARHPYGPCGVTGKYHMEGKKK